MVRIQVDRKVEVNPARAGMIPSVIRVSDFETSKPRASGDDPIAIEILQPLNM